MAPAAARSTHEAHRHGFLTPTPCPAVTRSSIRRHRPGTGLGAAPGRAPAGLPRGVIILLGSACAVVVVAGLRGVSDLVGPVFLALMLTVTVSPATGWMRRHGAPAWLAMSATIATVYLVLFALGGALVVSAARLADLMPSYQDQFTSLRADLIRWLGALGISEQHVRDALAGADPSSAAHLVSALVGGFASLLSNTVFVLAVLLFMCMDAVHFPARLLATVTERPFVVDALLSFARGTRRYLLVCTIFGLVVATFDTLLLWALGIPLPLLWGLLYYIPNIGFILGVVPPALLGLLQGGVHLMTAVVVLYCAVNFVIQSVIQPKIVGDAVGLSAAVSFLALVFWGWVLGALGALLAIPLTLPAKGLLVDVDPDSRWLNALLAGGPPPARPAARNGSAAGPSREGGG